MDWNTIQDASMLFGLLVLLASFVERRRTRYRPAREPRAPKTKVGYQPSAGNHARPSGAPSAHQIKKPPPRLARVQATVVLWPATHAGASEAPTAAKASEQST